jgi:hypothetical protein
MLCAVVVVSKVVRMSSAAVNAAMVGGRRKGCILERMRSVRSRQWSVRSEEVETTEVVIEVLNRMGFRV